MPPRPQEGGDLCAIFIHAGAGYHSHQNEKLHLTAVNDAAKVGMAILKNGGDALDAAEMAIRLLEDKEITNSGYGSNLTMDGLVECDATMVDHFGRSGAVGAMSQVKNPIAVARLVLDESIKPLSLQRVPPNLLVGDGATDYAAEKGIPIVPPDFLVSSNARERWLRWRRDLEDARLKETHPEPPTASQDDPSTASAWGGSPISPSASPPASDRRPSLSQLPPMIRPLVASTADVPTLAKSKEDRTLTSHASTTRSSITNTPENPSSTPDADDVFETEVDDNGTWHTSAPKRQKLNGSFDGTPCDELSIDGDRHPNPATEQEFCRVEGRQDEISDTVGAIAIDCFGRIAAGSSSGGIGMKHKGRCGPAALVGTGTAIIPVDPDDPTQTCVATVTSGTGEHMATTIAAATAADRIYNSVRRERGRLVPCSEDEAMHSAIRQEFMTHPGVSNSHCTGAIGILAVKKTREGIYFYFGHNTDSFAIASMHSEERKPVCTMSRSKGNGSIAQGGRVSRAKHARARS